MSRSARLPAQLILAGLIVAVALTAHLASADHVPPSAGVIDIIAIDMDPTDNTPTSVGVINSCRTGSPNDQIEVDVVVDEVHASDMVSVNEFDLVYDHTLLRVLFRSAAAGTLIGQAGSYLDTGDTLPDSDGNYRHSARDLTGPHEHGEGTLVRLTLLVIGSGVSQLQLTDNLEMDGEPDIRDANDEDIPINQILNAQIRTDGSSCEPDDDADGWVNSADNCRYWYNPAQNLPAWTVPAGDSDCDGFPDTVTASGRGRETFITTDAADHCPDTTIANDEQGPLVGEPVSPWPPDINDTRTVNLSDVSLLSPAYNKLIGQQGYDQRKDLNANNGVTLSDVSLMSAFYNRSCSP